MWKEKFKARRNVIILVSIFLFSFALMTANTKRSSGPFFFESLFLWIVAPIQSLFTHTVDGISDVIQHYFMLVGVAQENERLRRQVDAMTRANNALREEVKRLNRVNRLLAFQEQDSKPSVVATIIGRDATQWVKAVYIDKGMEDGVRENLPVVTDVGLVGHVVQSGPISSKVLLIVDRRSAIDAYFQESRVPGIVIGTGGATCEMKFVPITAEVAVGDRVLSSGLGGLFPKGLMVGRVVAVSRGRQGLFQEIRIAPSVDLTRLEEVLVLLS